MKSDLTTPPKFLKFLPLLLLFNGLSAQRLPLDHQNKYFLQTAAGLSFEGEDWNLRQDFTAGVEMEYFLSRQISLVGGFQYLTFRYKKDIPAYHPSSPGWGFNFSWGQPYDAVVVDARASGVMMPLAVKWEFRIVKNLTGFLGLGIGAFVPISQKVSTSSNTIYSVDHFSVTAHSRLGFSYWLDEGRSISLQLSAFPMVGAHGEETTQQVKFSGPSANVLQLGYRWQILK